MSDLVEVCIYHLVRLHGRSAFSKKVVEDFWDVNFPCVTVEGRVFDSNMNSFSSFSGNLFAILVYCLEVGDIYSGVVIGNDVFVNCTGDITIVLFYSIFLNICWIILCEKSYNFLWAGPFVDYVLF